MFSFVRKLNPFRRDSVRIQNDLLPINAEVTASHDLPFHSAEQSHCSKIIKLDVEENIPVNRAVVGTQRKGINKLLRKFEKENIKVSTLMDQDGRIFFSIEMTDIIEDDDELKNIAKVVQESILESYSQPLMDKEADEVNRKLKRHFLFESTKNVIEDGTIQESYIHNYSPKEKNYSGLSEISEQSLHGGSCSEKTLIKSEPTSTKRFDVSTDETELNSLLYSYLVSKMKKHHKSKSRNLEESLNLVIHGPFSEDQNKKEIVRGPKKQFSPDIKKNLVLPSKIKIAENQVKAQIMKGNKRDESNLKHTEETNCKHKQVREADGAKRVNTNPRESLQILKKHLERKFRKKFLDKGSKTKTRNKRERKQESIEHVPKKHKHNEYRSRKTTHERHNRGKSRQKTAYAKKHYTKSQKEITEENYEKRLGDNNAQQEKQTGVQSFHRYDDFSPCGEGMSTSKNSNKAVSNDFNSEEATRKKCEDFENDISEEVLTITSFE